MATITRENIGLLNDKIVVTVAKDDYLPSFEKSLKGYAKQANIPGFRKGMVPAGVVRKMYGASVFTEEVLRSVEKGLSDYMAKEQLEIFAQPLPLPENDAAKIDVNSPADYVFAFEVGLKPAFSIADLATAKTIRYKITVTDEMLNEEVARMQTRHGNMTEPEAVDTEENMLNVTFIESDAAGNEAEGGVKKDNSVLVKYFTPALQSQLMGKKKDESLVINIAAAFGDKEREWIVKDLGITEEEAANKNFKLLITKVGLVEKAPFEEALFKAAYPNREDIATEADFRNAVKEDIEKYLDSQSRNQLQDQIYHQLLDHTQIEFPESFLKRWMETGGEKPKSAEEVAAEYPSFINSLKWTLIIDKLVKENNIEVNPDDLRAFAKQQLMGYMGGAMMDMDQPWVNDYIERMMKDRKYVEDSYHRIQTDKVFAWAESQVNPTEKAISVDEFNKLQEGHHHHH
jgi:trigger factor